MKLDRLLAIVILLLNRRMVQAKELAERFEVSVRTIYRDIETINRAGIPILTYQGSGGGIGLAEGYRLDRNVLTNDELAAIVTALRSISTSRHQPENRTLVEKLSSIVPPANTEAFRLKASQVLIDFSPWGPKGPLEQKQQLLKEAINAMRLVRFQYTDAQGEASVRTVEPHTLIWKGREWYLQAYCRNREQFRLFKLSRMKELKTPDESFTRRELPDAAAGVDREWHAPERAVSITLRFDARIRHLAHEWFDAEELEPQENGDWIVRTSYPENEWLYGFILSFGPSVEVLEPRRLREVVIDRAERILNLYRKPDPT